MTQESKTKKKVHKIIEELASRDEGKVMRALKKVPHDGNKEVIVPLLRLLATEPSSEVQLLLEKSLHNLKDPSCVAPLIESLKDEELSQIRAEILTCIWQSGLDASEELEFLVQLSIDGDFMIAVEVMTIIDNMEGFPDDPLTNSIKLMDKALDSNHENAKLLGNIRQILLGKLLD
jgi:hypothetical protein